MNILEKLLKHRGLESETELTPEEKADFDAWREIFTREISIETLTKFLDRELVRLSDNLVESAKDGNKELSSYLSAQIRTYKNILIFIQEPEKTKEQLEAQLLALIQE